MLSSIRNLDYTVILCQDVQSMKNFYHNHLGFPLYRDFGDWIELHVGATLLTLRTRGTGYDGMREHDGNAPAKGSASLQLAFRVAPSQLESCFDELRQKDVVIVQGPANQPSGHRTFFFKDPEDNILEIYADL